MKFTKSKTDRAAHCQLYQVMSPVLMRASSALKVIRSPSSAACRLGYGKAPECLSTCCLLLWMSLHDCNCLITFFGCNQATLISPIQMFQTSHLLHEKCSSMSSVTNRFFFLNVDHLSLKSSERIRITTCMWLVVWKSKSSLLRRHFRYSGEVSCCKICF